MPVPEPGNSRGVVLVPTPSLVTLVAALEQRAAQAEAEGATAPVANVYRLVLAELRPLLDGNGAAPPDAAPAAALLSAPEVAARLGIATKTVYRSAGRWPFTRHVGRAVRFDSRGLESWLARLR